MGVVVTRTRLAISVIDPWEVRVIRYARTGPNVSSKLALLRRVLLQERPVLIATEAKSQKQLGTLLGRDAPAVVTPARSAVIRLLRGDEGNGPLADAYPEIRALPRTLSKKTILRAVAVATLALININPKLPLYARKWRQPTK